MTSGTDHHTSLLRIACAALCRARNDQLHSISLTLRLRGTPEEGPRLVRASRLYAEEYGLRQVVRLDGLSLTVRFTRDRPAPREGRRAATNR